MAAAGHDRGLGRQAVLAALALIAIQVGIGIIMKTSQSGGVYSFSPSASVTISEFFKMLISTAFFWLECKGRVVKGVFPSRRGLGNSEYASVPESDDLPLASRADMENDERGHKITPRTHQTSLDLRTFRQYIYGEVTIPVRYGFCLLALFYVLINNSVFISYMLADPGTIQLTKSGVTFITALVMIIALGAKITRTQWIAIVIQICGLSVTQYDPSNGLTFPLSTYLILLFQVFLSASSGVYNQALLKTDESSLHADNMILYAAGAVINFLCHIAIRMCKPEPSFFQGFNSFGALMVIFSNVLIGLAITAVYRYADAVIKCFATAIATGILLFLGPILFATPISFLVLPGTITVFIASWLYMEYPAPKSDPFTIPKTEQSHGSASRVFHNLFGLMTCTIGTIIAVTILTVYGQSDSIRAHQSTTDSVVQSPFRDTVAMVRWNWKNEARLPNIMQYEPFFHAVHISMPDVIKSSDLPPPNDLTLEQETPHDLTSDKWEWTTMIYRQVAHTMELILNTQPNVDGLLYYHFDAWIDPLSWATADRSRINYPAQAEPDFACMKRTDGYNWWGWAKGFQDEVKAAERAIVVRGLDYVVNPAEWCVGWSDIYFVPRRYFADYIALAEIFWEHKVWHEVAIPTILHIIDSTERSRTRQPAIDLMTDCWGSCCSKNPTKYDVLQNRCGHRLNYLDAPISGAFYAKLKGQADALGKTPSEATQRLDRNSDIGDAIYLSLGGNHTEMQGIRV